MSDEGLRQAQQKMRDAHVSQPAIDVFTYYYRALEEGQTGLIREDTIEPLLDVPQLSDVQITEEQARDAFAKTVIIKLNGGLGTSMGLAKAKSLLPVRDGKNFLDLVTGQILAARERHGVRLPLLLLNSFRTRDDSLAALSAYPELVVDDLPLDILQNQEPKLRVDDLTPVSWPDDPMLEWCPPGHGDLYTALESSGVLVQLVERGFRYASVSNGDNLGAAPDATIAGWFAQSGAPYAAELCRRTANDKKGGHLAVRKRDGQLILRDTAQTAPDEMHYFTDEFRHPYFHTNNLWFDIAKLLATLQERESVLGLPLIRNEKTVDPADPSSTPVYQIETAMGAAIEVFEGATAIAVGRDRFLPVKTTNELLLVRSDVYELTPAQRLTATTDVLPEIDLDPAYYKTVGDFTRRIPEPPSLREATSLTVRGDWTFEAGVRVVGSAVLDDLGAPSVLESGTRIGS